MAHTRTRYQQDYLDAATGRSVGVINNRFGAGNPRTACGGLAPTCQIGVESYIQNRGPSAPVYVPAMPVYIPPTVCTTMSGDYVRAMLDSQSIRSSMGQMLNIQHEHRVQRNVADDFANWGLDSRTFIKENFKHAGVLR